jgi:endoglucanase
MQMSHSEGQGCGLLLAVAAGDRPTFDGILNWTVLNLFIRYDNLPAWRWNWGLRTSHETNDAGDGDILIAWALAEAADFWNDPSYLSTARAITKDIVRNLIMPTSFGDVIMPGVEGFSTKEQPDAPVINLSYWVFPAFYRLAQVDPTYDWAALYQSGLELIRRAAFGASRLAPDRLSVAGESTAPARRFEERFGYDAIRIPLYLFWARAGSSEFFNRLQSARRDGASVVGLGEGLAPPLLWRNRATRQSPQSHFVKQLELAIPPDFTASPRSRTTSRRRCISSRSSLRRSTRVSASIKSK